MADFSPTPDSPEPNVRAAYAYLADMVRKFAGHSSLTLMNKLQIAETAMELGPQVTKYAAAGQCFYCGRHPKEDGYYTCEDCNTLDNEEARARAVAQHQPADRVSVSHITDDMARQILQAVADPGHFLKRGGDYTEPIPAWSGRAVVHVLNEWLEQREEAALLAVAEARAAADTGERHSLGDVAREFGVDLGGVSVGCAATTGTPANGITDDMVRSAAEALSTYICSDPDEWKWYDEHARLALEAALAGCTVGVLPDPDDTDEYGPRWDTERDMPIRVEVDGGSPVVWDCDRDMSPESAEQHGLALLAAAREARRLAAGSQVGDQ